MGGLLSHQGPTGCGLFSAGDTADQWLLLFLRTRLCMVQEATARGQKTLGACQAVAAFRAAVAVGTASGATLILMPRIPSVPGQPPSTCVRVLCSAAPAARSIFPAASHYFSMPAWQKQ